MKKLYIVSKGDTYDGYQPIAAFSSMKAAEACAEKANKGPVEWADYEGARISSNVCIDTLELNKEPS
jgi:hypothetical protein